jgi:hypothetical protein
MKADRHIKKIQRHCHHLAEHGHCHTHAQFIAINDVDIAVAALAKSFAWEQTFTEPKHGRKRKE